MGDMADFINSQEDVDFMDDPDRPGMITCKYCGLSGLQWAPYNGKWMLFERSARHMCSEYFKAKTLTLGELNDKGDGTNE